MAEELFTMEVEEDNEGKRGIPGATILKTHAVALASEIMAKIPTADADFIERVKESQSNVAALDNLVKDECGEKLNNEDIAQFGEEEVKKLLKSNQSNRSRRKNMAMTQANYVELLTAACAEWLLRESCGITKNANPFGGGRTAITINEETVAELAEDQEALGRAIRNVQSKKSTYKAKHVDNPDYEQDEEWQLLLEQEAMLKAVRKTQPAGRKGVSVKKALQFIFDGVGDVATLGKDESHALLQACAELAQGIYPAEYLNLVSAEQEAMTEETAEEADVYADEEL